MNVQNIPRDWKDVKRGFIPKKDGFLFFDFKNIEPRLLAYYMAISINDYSMADEFCEGLDPYIETAKVIFNTDNVTDEQRQICKTLMLMTNYGAGAWKIAQTLGVTNYQASRFLSKFHKARPGIRKLNEKIKAMLYEREASLGQGRGFIKTYHGRHLHPGADHKALNALMQGGAADIMKFATVKVHKHLKENNFESHIVNIVHDELIIDTVVSERAALIKDIPGLMDEPTISEIVPIQVDVEWADTNWGAKVSAEDSLEEDEDY